MNKNAEKYKQTYSALHPSDEAIERAMNMKKEKSTDKYQRIYKQFAAAALALVLFIGGGFGINRFANKSNDFKVLIAYADSEEYISPLNEQGVFCGIYVAPLEDKEITKNMHHRFFNDISKLNQEYDNLLENNIDVSGIGHSTDSAYNAETEKEVAEIWFVRSGAFALTLDDYSEVKSFKVENSSPYGTLLLDYEREDGDVFEHLPKNFDDLPDAEKERIFLEITAEFGMWGKRLWELSGDELRFSQDTGIQNKKGYVLEWAYSSELNDAIGKNPYFDLSQIKDTITFTVTFNNGSVKTASLNLYFDKDGYMHFE